MNGEVIWLTLLLRRFAAWTRTRVQSLSEVYRNRAVRLNRGLRLNRTPVDTRSSLPHSRIPKPSPASTARIKGNRREERMWGKETPAYLVSRVKPEGNCLVSIHEEGPSTIHQGARQTNMYVTIIKTNLQLDTN